MHIKDPLLETLARSSNASLLDTKHMGREVSTYQNKNLRQTRVQPDRVDFMASLHRKYYQTTFCSVSTHVSISGGCLSAQILVQDMIAQMIEKGKCLMRADGPYGVPGGPGWHNYDALVIIAGGIGEYFAPLDTWSPLAATACSTC